MPATSSAEEDATDVSDVARLRIAIPDANAAFGRMLLSGQ
jgi:hypothetical protein